VSLLFDFRDLKLDQNFDSTDTCSLKILKPDGKPPKIRDMNAIIEDVLIVPPMKPSNLIVKKG